MHPQENAEQERRRSRDARERDRREDLLALLRSDDREAEDERRDAAQKQLRREQQPLDRTDLHFVRSRARAAGCVPGADVVAIAATILSTGFAMMSKNGCGYTPIQSAHDDQRNQRPLLARAKSFSFWFAGFDSSPKKTRW